MGYIFYIMGKSAVGKDHFYRDLLSLEELSLKPLILYTTRPPRDGETDGKEYFFVDEARLARLRTEGRLIEERVYRTAAGPWHYATVDDGQLDPKGADYLAIGTLESYLRLREYFGPELLVPLYIETEDAIRLERAIKREKKQKPPNFVELCRRFVADSEDFSGERLEAAGIRRSYSNNGTREECSRLLAGAVRQRQIRRKESDDA